MGRRARIRQHVNPRGFRYLAARAQPVELPVRHGPRSRVIVELGCADADFSFAIARCRPDCTVVGADIREAILAANRRRASAEGLANLHFSYVNLNVDADRLFAAGTVDEFHLLFPDPWFKSRHHKRRVLDRALLATLVDQLTPAGELHMASDVFEVALDMMAVTEVAIETGFPLVNLREPWSFWRDNPFAAMSRREVLTRARGQRVWRVRYGRGASDSIVGSARASGSGRQRS